MLHFYLGLENSEQYRRDYYEGNMFKFRKLLVTRVVLQMRLCGYLLINIMLYLTSLL